MGKQTFDALRWPSICWSTDSTLGKLFFHLPIVGTASHFHRSINQQLRKRTPNVLNLWGDYPSLIHLSTLCSPLIAQHFNWDNGLFIPTDPFDILFFDYTGDMVAIEAEVDIKACLNISDHLLLIECANNTLLYYQVIELMLQHSLSGGHGHNQ